MKNQLEKIGALQSAKKTTIKNNWAEEAKEKQHSGEKGALEKEQHNHEKELGKK